MLYFSVLIRRGKNNFCFCTGDRLVKYRGIQDIYKQKSAHSYAYFFTYSQLKNNYCLACNLKTSWISDESKINKVWKITSRTVQLDFARMWYICSESLLLLTWSSSSVLQTDVEYHTPAQRYDSLFSLTLHCLHYGILNVGNPANIRIQTFHFSMYI